MRLRFRDKLFGFSTALAAGAAFAGGFLAWAVRPSLGGTMALAAAVAAAAALAAFACCGPLTRPLDELMTALAEMGRGNFHYRSRIGSDDELGRIGRAIDALAQDMHKAQELSLRSYKSSKFAEIGWIASGVGHELKSPLNAALNAVFYIREALKGSPLHKEDPALQEMLELSERELRNISNIISDLLSFSRVVTLNLERGEVHGLLDEAVGRLEVPENVKIRRAYSPEAPKAFLDPGKVRQVFVNLARNAIQAMPEGGTLGIATKIENDGRGAPEWVVVEFTDTGVGIPPEKLGKMYEPIFTSKAKGAGMGLVLSNRVVAAHDGAIEVQSEVGKGSSFTVKLPLAGPRRAGMSQGDSSWVHSGF